MTRTPSDQFSKQYLETFLSPLGTVEISREIPGEAQWIDLWFEPHPDTDISSPYLGLLGRIATTACLLEPFRNQPTMMEVFRCKYKHISVLLEFQRQAERENRRIPDSLEGLPWLWILAATASKPLIQRLRVEPDPHWPLGVYFDSASRMGFVVINQLPVNQDTLWIRLLGRGKTQQQAIETVLEMGPNTPHRGDVLQLLVTWKICLEVTGNLEQEEADLMATLSQVYLEWEQRTRQKGIEQGIEQGERSLIFRLLTRRLGAVPPQILEQINALSLTQLELLGEALLDFTEITDLTNWLEARLGEG
jgi:hypothetical protein